MSKYLRGTSGWRPARRRSSVAMTAALRFQSLISASCVISNHRMRSAQSWDLPVRIGDAFSLSTMGCQTK
uniref:Uncharacterized protein n=1 Tax=Arundo donax TaxID=35708 RepID=A0A0A9DDU2_ARUDO